MVEQGDSLSWSMMPELQRRVKAFCETYDGEADPVVVVAILKQSFVSPTPGMVGWLHLDEFGKVIGHCLLTVGDWMGTKIVTVLQLELERSLTPELGAAMMSWIERFGRANQAKHIHCTTRNEAIARLFARQYGFSKKLVWMARPINVTQMPAMKEASQ